MSNLSDGIVTRSGQLAGSLRQAVYDANANPGDDTIVFDSSLAGQTITLKQGELRISDTTGETSIDGLGSTSLTISGGNTTRVFEIASGATVDISGLSITRGHAVGAAVNGCGGGLYNSGTLTLSDCSLVGNYANNGGGLCNAGTLTITDSTVVGNYAVYTGGGIANNATGTLSIENSTFSQNLAESDGGGICNDGELTIAKSTFSQNSTSYYGGAIFNTGNSTVAECTFVKNGAGLEGGGIYNSEVLQITESTLYNNYAAYAGGGLYNINQSVNGGIATITNCTIANNTANYGGGIYSDDGTYGGAGNGTATKLANTIVANNIASLGFSDVYGPITADYCLIESVDSSTIFANYIGSNIIGVDPLLGALADNGGPTQTVALLEGSEAINAGNNSLISSGDTTDQRGATRIVAGAVDIGAYEYVDPLLVTTTDDVIDWHDGLTSLREAVAYANSHQGDDTISFDSSLAGKTVLLTDGELDLTDNTGWTIIVGLGSDNITVSGNDNSRVFYVASNAVAAISGITITGGETDTNGGGIDNDGTLYLDSSVITRNAACEGAGLFNSGTATISNSTITENTAAVEGGGVANAGNLLVSSSSISANSADNGGGIANNNCSALKLSDSTLFQNTANSSGGGLYNNGSLSVANSSFRNNAALNGGGVFNDSPDGTADIVGSYFTENSSVQNGGGIHNDSSLTLRTSTISGNIANGTATEGGGVFNLGSLTIIDTTVSNNSAANGGGIENVGTMAISGSTIAGNSADQGGGIENSDFVGSTLSITNSTIAENIANYAGGILNHAQLMIADSTIAYNSGVGDAGGIVNDDASVAAITVLSNTIVADNGANDIAGTVTANSCLIESPTTTVFSSNSGGNILGEDPLLGTLTDNGGPTQTIALLAGSVAIDAGNNTLIPSDVTTDQRGAVRIVGESVDIGAYEYLDPLVVTTSDDVVDWKDGETSLREAVTYANSHSGDDTITFALSLAGDTITLTHGELELTDTAGLTTINGLGADQLTVSGNHSSRVFHIDTGVTADISGLTISQGSSDGGFGGGIYNAGTLTISGTAVTENSSGMALLNGEIFWIANGNGGGIYNSGTMTIVDSTISGNQAGWNIYLSDFPNSATTYSPYYSTGGGISNSGVMTIENSTVAENSAYGVVRWDHGFATYVDGRGGGVYNTGSLTIADSTIAKNTSAKNKASSYGNAGGIDNEQSLTLINTIVADNGVIVGDNIVYAGISNLMLAGSSAVATSEDVYGKVTAKYSLIENTNGVTFATGSAHNLTNVDPLLGDLGYYGGTTETIPLLLGSQAINAGSDALIPSGVSNDERGVGYDRIVGSGVDIGAFELTAAPTVTFTVSPTITDIAATSTTLEQIYTNTSSPLITVTVSGTAYTSPDGAIAYLDVDTNNDGDFDATDECIAGVLTGGEWTFTFTAIPDGTYGVRARAFDGAGSEGVSDTSKVIVDTVGPVVTISAPSTKITATSSVTYTVTLSDANLDENFIDLEDYVHVVATGTATGDITLPGDVQWIAQTSTSVTYLVTIENISGDGTLGIAIDAGSAADYSDNVAASVHSTSFIVDNTAPVAAISAPSKTMTASQSVSYTVTFSDENLAPTTLPQDISSSIVLSGTGSAGVTIVSTLRSSATQHVATYVVTLSGITGDGTLSISVLAGAISDAAGNSSQSAEPSAAVLVDNTAPVVTFVNASQLKLLNTSTPTISVDAKDSGSGIVTTFFLEITSADGTFDHTYSVPATVVATNNGMVTEGKATFTPSLADGAYTLRAWDSDSVGNRGACVLSTTMTIATHPAISKVVITAKTSADKTTITWNEADSKGLGSTVLTIDGVSCKFTNTCGKTSASYTYAGQLAAGVHTATITAYNSKGQRSSYSESFTVTPTAPTISNVSCKASLCSKSWTVANPTKITWTTSDIDGVGAGTLTIDGVAVAGSNIKTSGQGKAVSYTYVGNIIGGTHHFTIKVTDAFGVASQYTGTFAVQATAPTISAVKVTATTSAVAATIGWSASDLDGIQYATVKIDGAAPITVTPLAGGSNTSRSYLYSALMSAGKHTYTITVVTSAGLSLSKSGSLVVSSSATLSSKNGTNRTSTAVSTASGTTNYSNATTSSKTAAVDLVFASY